MLHAPTPPRSTLSDKSISWKSLIKTATTWPSAGAGVGTASTRSVLLYGLTPLMCCRRGCDLRSSAQYIKNDSAEKVFWLSAPRRTYLRFADREEDQLSGRDVGMKKAGGFLRRLAWFQVFDYGSSIWSFIL
jgi:hypothetical protein